MIILVYYLIIIISIKLIKLLNSSFIYKARSTQPLLQKCNISKDKNQT